MERIDCCEKAEFIGTLLERSDVDTDHLCAGSIYYAVDVKQTYVWYNGEWKRM